MATLVSEITTLEERLRQAELGPEANVFEDLLADDVVLVSQEGQPFSKARVVEAHQPGKGPKFTRVEMNQMVIREHGPNAAVVTCKGYYESAQWTGTLAFMRVWLKKNGRWQVIAASISNVNP
jgi:hypothetical protein